jgi:hypothetical protein
MTLSITPYRSDFFWKPFVRFENVGPLGILFAVLDCLLAIVISATYPSLNLSVDWKDRF